MKKRLLLIISALIIASHPLPVLAVDAEDYEILLEDYNELKSKYKKLKKKYNELKAQYEGTEDQEGEEAGPSSDPEASEDTGEYIFETDGFTYKYLRSEIYQSNGTDFLVVHFNYLNESGKESNACGGATIRAFQNNVSAQTYTLIGSGIDDLNNGYTAVRSGGNIDFALGFEIKSMDDVIISMSPYFRTETAYEFVIHLPGMETELLN